MTEERKLLEELSEAASELAQYASYAEIVGAIHHNQVAIRKWSDKVFEVNRKVKDFLEKHEEDPLG